MADTDSGRKWTSQLYSNVFSQEHRAILSNDGFELLSRIPKILKSNDLNASLEQILAEVCEYQGWPVGHIYEVNKKGKTLSPTSIWFFNSKKKGTKAFQDITMKTSF